ncbi:MAG: hypothetical protein RMY64_23370 [Nostoc sp. DedQUE08]|uniref:hypothetical protein n=1 Tax=Nostoc sp. DedQUE08 TaxID=3075393 RepID=UPI002AD59821|nr:hypothetical protein [Nostoc sp. DedQUE08]MDZ8068534.1 hypothetical protein [Nostoc sp. DedQUE08]
MTYHIYSQQQLQLKSIARLKQIYSEIACTVEVNDKRCKDAWITAIADYQSSKIQKLAPAAPDNQAIAQAELDNYIAHQAQVVAPEPLTIVEISFDHHEYYAGNQLIANISHDDNHLTQRWVGHGQRQRSISCQHSNALRSLHLHSLQRWHTASARRSRGAGEQGCRGEKLTTTFSSAPLRLCPHAFLFY